MRDDFQLVLTTAGSGTQAEAIARALVERRLAACVNVLGGICSFFRWEDKIQREDEKLLVIKSARSLFPRVRETIQELHSYDVPEVLAIAIADGEAAYLKWLDGALDGTSD